MSYLVIARKWRPRLFEDIVGQAHITRTLKNAVQSGRIAHAYLFSGPRGVGKTTAARILAKCLNCLKGPTPTPCNECHACNSIAASSAIDVFEIDGASNTGVENIRELTEGVKYVPAEGRYKVYIIDEVHMLSGHAFNALLKTLEEPPPHVVFIFATTEAHKLPATVLSRCQRFDFRRIPFKEIITRLKSIVEAEGLVIDEAALFLMAREADGSLRDAQSLLEQVLSFSDGPVTEAMVSDALGFLDSSELFSLAEAIIKKDAKTCLDIVENIYNFGYDLKRICVDLLKLLRDLLVIKVTGEFSLLDLPDAELEHLKGLARGIGAERLHALFGAMAKGYEEVSRSAYPRYALEMSLLKALHANDGANAEVKVDVGVKSASPEGVRRPDDGAAPRVFTAKKDAPAPELPKPDAGLKAGEEAEKYPVGKALPDNAGIPPPASIMEFVKLRNARLHEQLRDAKLSIGQGVVDVVVKGRAGALIIKKDVLEGLFSEYLKAPVKANIRTEEAVQENKADDIAIKSAVRILGGRVVEDRRR
ncbi:MAG: DNA polymerase III subunit gamma/tau [Deltaproteobacteria bacterium]